MKRFSFGLSVLLLCLLVSDILSNIITDVKIVEDEKMSFKLSFANLGNEFNDPFIFDISSFTDPTLGFIDLKTLSTGTNANNYCSVSLNPNKNDIKVKGGGTFCHFSFKLSQVPDLDHVYSVYIKSEASTKLTQLYEVNARDIFKSVLDDIYKADLNVGIITSRDKVTFDLLTGSNLVVVDDANPVVRSMVSMTFDIIKNRRIFASEISYLNNLHLDFPFSPKELHIISNSCVQGRVISQQKKLSILGDDVIKIGTTSEGNTRVTLKHLPIYSHESTVVMCELYLSPNLTSLDNFKNAEVIARVSDSNNNGELTHPISMGYISIQRNEGNKNNISIYNYNMSGDLYLSELIPEKSFSTTGDCSVVDDITHSSSLLKLTRSSKSSTNTCFFTLSDNILNHQIGLSWHELSPQTTVYVHNSKESENSMFFIDFEKHSQNLHLYISNPNSLHRYCFSLEDYNNPYQFDFRKIQSNKAYNSLYSIEQVTQDHGKINDYCKQGSYILSFNLYSQDYPEGAYNIPDSYPSASADKAIAIPLMRVGNLLKTVATTSISTGSDISLPLTESSAPPVEAFKPVKPSLYSVPLHMVVNQPIDTYKLVGTECFNNNCDVNNRVISIIEKATKYSEGSKGRFVFNINMNQEDVEVDQTVSISILGSKTLIPDCSVYMTDSKDQYIKTFLKSKKDSIYISSLTNFKIPDANLNEYGNWKVTCLMYPIISDISRDESEETSRIHSIAIDLQIEKTNNNVKVLSYKYEHGLEVFTLTEFKPVINSYKPNLTPLNPGTNDTTFSHKIELSMRFYAIGKYRFKNMMIISITPTQSNIKGFNYDDNDQSINISTPGTYEFTLVFNTNINTFPTNNSYEMMYLETSLDPAAIVKKPIVLSFPAPLIIQSNIGTSRSTFNSLISDSSYGLLNTYIIYSSPHLDMTKSQISIHFGSKVLGEEDFIVNMFDCPSHKMVSTERSETGEFILTLVHKNYDTVRESVTNKVESEVKVELIYNMLRCRVYITTVQVPNPTNTIEIKNLDATNHIPNSFDSSDTDITNNSFHPLSLTSQGELYPSLSPSTFDFTLLYSSTEHPSSTLESAKISPSYSTQTGSLEVNFSNENNGVSTKFYVMYENPFNSKINHCEMYDGHISIPVQNINSFVTKNQTDSSMIVIGPFIVHNDVKEVANKEIPNILPDIPTDVHIDRETLFNTLQFPNKTNSHSFTCSLQLNPKQLNNTDFRVALLPAFKLLYPESILPSPLSTLQTVLERNLKTESVKDIPLAIVNWSLQTSHTIETQIKRAKQIVAKAGKTKEDKINLVDLAWIPDSTNGKENLPLSLTSLSHLSLSEVAHFYSKLNTGVTGKVSGKFSGGFDGIFNIKDIENALNNVILQGGNDFNDMSTSAVIDQIFSECIAAGYGCGDLCAPCTGNDPCKSDFDCFSGVCSFGQCVSFDKENNNNAFALSAHSNTFITVFLSFIFLAIGLY